MGWAGRGKGMSAGSQSAEPASAGEEFSQGWTKVLTGLIGVGLGSSAIFFYTQGLFLKSLSTEFGWTRSQASVMPTLYGLALAATGPLCGLAVDRFGVRRVTSISILCLSLGFYGLSVMNGSLLQFGAIVLFVAIFGSATSAVPYVRLVGSWFDAKRGLAIGITMMGPGFAALIAPRLVGAYLTENGWRAAYQALAALVLLALPLVLLWGRDRGRGDHSRARAEARPVTGLTFRQAASQRRFWVLGVTFTLAGAAIAGLVPHFIPMLQDQGMTPAQAGAAFGWAGLAIIGGRFLTGFLCDHFFAPLIGTAVLGLVTLGCVGLAVFGPSFAVVGALLIGLGMGAEIDLVAYMSARYFGLRSYGAILGFQYGLFALGAGLGPLLNGYLFDRFGNYQVALLTAAGVLLLGIPFLLSMGRYPERDAGEA